MHIKNICPNYNNVMLCFKYLNSFLLRKARSRELCCTAAAVDAQRGTASRTN